MQRMKLKLAGGTAVLVAAIGGGAALAADKLSPKAESDAIVADVAKELGVSSAKLEAALKQALENRVDAAVASGRLTEAQATELKQRIAAGDVPLVGLGHGGHHRGPHGDFHRAVDLGVAATYLAVTEDSLRTSLRNGSTLAEVAEANGKTAAGLAAALLADAKAELDEAVASGRLTEAQGTKILVDLPGRIDDAVAGELRFRFHLRGEPGELEPALAPSA